MHNYGSRNWTSDERDPLPLLGETEAKQQWSNGAPPAGIPAPALIGSADCVANGERWPLPLIVRDLDTGFDSRCPPLLPPVPIPPPPPPIVIDGTNCRDQQTFAAAVNERYRSGDATSVIQARWPSAICSNIPDTSSTIPGSTIALIGDTTIIVISGTTNAQQLALQAVGGGQQPTNMGPYGTIPLWQTAADMMVRRIDAAGGSATGRIVIVGHSYGGAVACILGFRYSRGNRSVHLVTFGCPKPGDQRLIDGLDRTAQRHFVNDDDIVPFLPPNTREVAFGLPVASPALAAAWDQWRKPRNMIGVSVTGERRDNPDPGTLFSLFFRVIWNLVHGEEPETFTAHFSSEYARRVRCPADPAPSPTPGSMPAVWFQNETLDPYPNGGSLSVWQDSTVNKNDGTVLNNTNQLGVFTDPSTFNGVSSIIGFNLLLQRSLVLTGDFAAYIVCRIPSDHGSSSDNVSLGTNLAGTYLLNIMTDRVRTKSTRGTIDWVNGGNWDGLALFSVRRVGNTLTIRKNNDTLTGTIPAASRWTVQQVLPQHTVAPFHGNPALTAEVKVYDTTVSDAEDASEVARMLARYSIDGDTTVTGQISYFASATPVDGWLACDGAAYLISAFPSLAAYLAGGYNMHRGAAAPPSGQFRVPDLRGLVPVGGGANSVNPTTTTRAAGQTGGEEAHILSVGELAIHDHPYSDPGHSHTVIDPGHNHSPSNGANFLTDNIFTGASAVHAGGNEDVPHTTTEVTGITVDTEVTGIIINGAGNNLPHENMPPYAVLWPFIRT